MQVPSQEWVDDTTTFVCSVDGNVVSDGPGMKELHRAWHLDLNETLTVTYDGGTPEG